MADGVPSWQPLERQLRMRRLEQRHQPLRLRRWGDRVGTTCADNVGLTDLTLFKNREPGEKALSTLIESFEYNTTLVSESCVVGLSLLTVAPVPVAHQLAPHVAPKLHRQSLPHTQR